MPQILNFESRERTSVKLEKLLYSVQDGIAVITMNSVHNLNAIDEQMADELIAVLSYAEQDPKAKVIILRGTDKAFSSGGDIRYFYQQIQAGGEVDLDTLISKVDVLADDMKRMSKFIITSVSGAAAGAGVSIALGGDFMVCADNAKLMLAFVGLGLVPDTGAIYLLSKSIGASRAMELAATGRPLSSLEAKDLGVAHMVVPQAELDDAVMAFAKQLAAGPLVSYKNIKKQIYEANYSDYKKWLSETEGPTQHECALTADFQEGVKAFIEKRRAVFTGH